MASNLGARINFGTFSNSDVKYARIDRISGKEEHPPGPTRFGVKQIAKHTLTFHKSELNEILADSCGIHDWEGTGLVRAAALERRPAIHDSDSLGAPHTGAAFEARAAQRVLARRLFAALRGRGSGGAERERGMRSSGCVGFWFSGGFFEGDKRYRDHELALAIDHVLGAFYQSGERDEVEHSVPRVVQ